GEVVLDYRFEGQGMTGTASTRYDSATGDFVDSSVVGPTSGANGFDGRQAWQRDASGAVTPQDGGDKRQLAVNEAYRDANAWWMPDHGGARIEALPGRTEGGHAYDVLSVTPAGGKAFEAWFDARTHLLARTIEPQGFLVATTRYDDWREVGGWRVPGRVLVDLGFGADQLQTMTLRKGDVVAARPAASYAIPRSTLADASIRNAQGRTTVPFKLINNHVYAEVKVNGKGPFLFIFDTGGHDLLDPAAAKALKVASEGKAAGGGAGEGSVDVSFASGVRFEIGDLEMHDQAISVLPIMSPAVEGIQEQGMMGFELFRRFVTTIDYGAQTLTFTDPARFRPGPELGTPVPFVFYDHLPQVRGTFEGAPGLFDIDTGSRAEITITKPFADANHLRESHPRGVVAVDGWGVGGRSVSYVARAKQLTLGPVEVDGLVAGFATQDKGAFSDPNFQGNVGTRLLKRFVVTFDYGHQVMYLKPRPAPVPDIDSFDRSGLWINAAPAGYEIVDVAKGSAGAEAGLVVGDRITRIDGAAPGALSLSDVRARLRDPKVDHVELVVQHAGAERTLTLRLRDQV
ncbi:MAG TPA: aspartyl protease family protein, partial [Burkholderiaceae bacterium]